MTYTKVGLFAVFAWMLWGDFCLTLMEAVVPNIIPLKLKDLGASNITIALIMSTLPGILNMTICPYVSFKSDRHRGKWGRRIPFILWTMPFLCASLALIGFSEDIAQYLRAHSDFIQKQAPATMTIVLIGVFVTMFQFFNMYVNSVFWYLFNDVIPAQFLARFVGYTRIVATIGSSLYSWFLYEHSVSHMREIMVGAAILYLVGFGLVCFMVKEGEYPPFAEGDAVAHVTRGSWFGRVCNSVKNFLKQSFSDPLYWMMFGITGLSYASGAISTFTPFFQQEMGLVLKDIGQMNAIILIASLCAMYFTAVFIDRWHPMRVSVYLSVLGLAGTAMGWVWLFVTLPGDYYFWLTMGIGLVSMFQSSLAGGCSFPKEMRLFPQSRFGQFCSAQALLRSACTMLAGIAAGAFIDLMQSFYPGSGYAYRFIVVWQIFFSIAIAILALFAYRRWYALGGDAHYKAPANWNSTGVEDMPIVTTVGPRTRWVSLALHLINALMLLTIALFAPLIWWMSTHFMRDAVWWHSVVLFPAAIVVWLVWKSVERGIRRDMERSRKGEPLRNGIIHHGCTIAMIITFLLMLPFWVAKVVVMTKLGMDQAAIIFTVANLGTNLVLSLSVWVIARVERGHLTKLDINLAETPP